MCDEIDCGLLLNLCWKHCMLLSKYVGKYFGSMLKYEHETNIGEGFIFLLGLATVKRHAKRMSRYMTKLCSCLPKLS